MLGVGSATAWVTAILAIAACGIGYVLLAFCYRATREEDALRDRALRGDAFLVQPIEEGVVRKCACGSGLFAGYNIAGGSAVNGPGCMQCVRRGVVNWLLQEHKVDSVEKSLCASR